MRRSQKVSGFPSRSTLDDVGIIALVFVAWIASAVGQQASAAASLAGTVRDSGGTAVANATLQLQSRDVDKSYATRTDSQGKYRFQVLPAGVYVLKIQASGYAASNIPSV